MTEGPVRMWRAIVWRASTVLMAGLLLTSVSTVALAQRASRPADEWMKVLDNPQRIAALKVDEVAAALKLAPGNIIADLGAGTGPFIPAFAKAVAPGGTVLAVEIDEGFFPHIRKRAQEAGVGNVRTVRGEPADPKLPVTNVDVAFFHDVLHHIEDRETYLKNLVKYLAPGARIVVIDYSPAQSPHRDDPSLQVSKEQTTAWLAAAGFKPVEEVDLYPDKWFVVYGR